MNKKLPTFLGVGERTLILFGGKGGSGKTTSACSVAISLAKQNPDKKILVVSTDPAHSLSDSFGCQIESSITLVSDVHNLWALEIKAEEIDRDFRRRYGDIIKKIADRGTYLDRQDIDEFSSLPLPGLDEVMAVIEISKILKDGHYNLIILDTAPTGHTLKLLAMPEIMARWVKVFNMMQAKHRYLVKQFTGRYIKDDADEFLELMARDLFRVRSVLRDSDTTEFIPVTIPEPLSIYETERLLETLKEYNIPVNNIIVNRVEIGREGCEFCSSRRKAQEKELAEIDKCFSDYNIYKLPLFPNEIRGIKRLEEFSEILLEQDRFSDIPVISGPLAKTTREGRVRRVALNRQLKFILFGGKGGVGKTSVSCATALRLARREPKKRILVFSTDPACSLTDSFGEVIGDKVTKIKELNNLYALEINARRLYEDFIKQYKEGVESAFRGFLSRGIDIKFDREVMRELISLTPPGLDEIMALMKIIRFVEDKEFDIYILDTAATGHLVRLLELPQLVRTWLNTIFRLIIKYKGVVKLDNVARNMVDLSKNIKRLQEILTSPDRSEFVLITIPETMGVLEADRLLDSLNNLGVPCRHILFNMVIPHNKCRFCSAKRNEQQKVIQEVCNRRSGGYRILEIPLFLHQIRGLQALEELAGCVYG